MQTAAKPAPAPLRVLLVSEKEEDFFLIREILERTRQTLAAQLDHAPSLEDARQIIERRAHDLVLFAHETGDAEAVQLLADTLRGGAPLPFILLTEEADEGSVAEIIEAGAWDCLAKSQLNGVNLARTIRTTLALHFLRQDQRIAGESLRKLSQAVEKSADLVMITSREGIIEYVNPAFEELTGYRREEVCGQCPRILKSGEQGPEVYQEMWKTILAGQVFRCIMVDRKKNGELFYLEQSICPVRDSTGRITHFISNGRDLTDRLRLEAQLLQAQKMDAVGRLAGGVAHDFNNLLTIITSYSELALDAVTRTGGLESKIQEILQAARRAAELTRQLLAFSRKQLLELKVVDVNRIVADMERLLQPLIGERVELQTRLAADLGRTRADAGQIEQVIMNLVVNSKDAMPEGGKITIQTANVDLHSDDLRREYSYIQPGAYVMLSVHDTGMGMDRETQARIFEPFFTTKEKGKGTGLGLSTVYGIIKQSGGYVLVQSEPRQGTTFQIYLPLVDEAAEPAGSVRASQPENGGSETVLLVEDEESVRQLVRETLEAKGYRVMEAENAEVALQQLHELHDLDMLITDVVMPGMSGRELAARLSATHPHTRVLYLSGYTEDAIVHEGVLEPGTAFLQKPFTLQMLSRKVREVLGNGRQPNARSATPSV